MCLSTKELLSDLTKTAHGLTIECIQTDKVLIELKRASVYKGTGTHLPMTQALWKGSTSVEKAHLYTMDDRASFSHYIPSFLC